MPAEQPKRQRQSQADRSAATRGRLLDATLDCLVELGWSGTTTTEVVRRAGVSRGAQVHHFPTKEDLVLAAVEHLCNRRLDEYRTAFQSLAAEERTPGAAFDLLRLTNGGPTFDAWLELTVASRRRPELQRRFVEQTRRFWKTALELNRELFPEAAADEEFNRVALLFAFSLSEGLAIESVAGAEQGELDAVADAFKDLTAPYFPSSQGAVHDEDPR